MQMRTVNFLLAAGLLAASPVMAAAPAPVVPTATVATAEANAADIARVEQYLSSITTIQADFNQTSTDGSLSKGKFYLKRPGKMRWQYSPPTPILIVSDGKAITYYDAELDQLSYIGVDDTLAGFLAQKDIKLNSKTTRLTNFESANGVIRATLVQVKKPDEGSLVLEFSDKPLQIKQMVVSDATGHVSHVQLENAKFGGPLDDNLFTFEDPRGLTHRKQK